MRTLLAELIGRYQTIAVRYLAGRLREPGAAEDLYQQVVTSILESGKDFASLEHLRNYFFVALRNAAVDHQRRRGRSREVLVEAPAELRDTPRVEPAESQLEAEEELARHEHRLGTLRRALRELPEAERQLILDRFWGRKTFQEIKDACGAPISTLKSREDAAMRKLRKAIGNEPEEP
jgi:RNA polymerase sigma-70 factor (ECF subfamily)